MAKGAENKKKEAEAQKLLNSRLQSAQTILSNYGAKAKEIADIQQRILDGEIKSNEQLTKAINNARKLVVEKRKAAEAAKKAAEANEDILDYIRESGDQAKKLTKQAQYFGKQGKSNLDILKSSIKEREKELKRYSQITGIDAKHLNFLKQQIKAQKDILDTVNIINQEAPNLAVAYSSAVDLADNLQDSITGIFSSLPGGDAINKRFGFDKISEQVNKGLVAGIDKVGASLAAGQSPLAAMRAGMAAFNATVAINPMVIVLGTVVAIAAVFKTLISVYKKISGQAKEIATATGVTYAQGKLLAKQALAQVTSLDNQLSLQKDIIDVMSETTSEFGTMSMLSAEQSRNISEIGKSFGYGAQQAAQVNNQFLRMGMNADDAANAQRDLAAEAVKAGVNVGMVTKDIADNAADMAKFFGGNVKALTKAALQAAKLGVSLKTMADVSEGLLRFEDSISAQFEFQALTGRQINLDAARELALRGDIAGATKEVLGAVGSIADFDNMSFLARKKLAEATGMSVAELQKSLIVQSKLGDLNEEDLATMNALGLSAAELKNMTAEQIQQKIAEKQASDKVAASFESMKASVADALLPAAEALMGVFQAMAPILKVIGYLAGAILAPIKLLGSLVNGTTDDLSTMEIVLGSIGTAMGIMYGYANRYAIASKLGLITDMQRNNLVAARNISENVNLSTKTRQAALDKTSLMTQLKINAQKALALTRDAASNVLAKIKTGFEKGNLLTLIAQNVQKGISFARDVASNALLAIRTGLEKTNLLTLISQNVQKGISFVRDQASNALAAARIVMDQISLGLAAAKAVAEQATLGALVAQAGATVKNIAKAGIELGIRVAVAAANLAAAAAATLGVGVPAILGATAVGLAAIGGLIYAMTADDLMSPGKGTPGYGSRTLTGPEGTIALNDKDTVIAGTNLFADDAVSPPIINTSPGISSPSITSPIGDTSTLETAINNLTTTISEMITGETATVDNNPVVTKLEEVKQALFGLDIRMDGKVVGETIRTSDSFRRR